VYSYDAVGSFEKALYSSSGSGNQLIQPFLDNQIGWKNQTSKVFNNPDDVVDLVKDAITSAGERDIFTGDAADIWLIDGQGIRTTKLDLKLD